MARRTSPPRVGHENFPSRSARFDTGGAPARPATPIYNWNAPLSLSIWHAGQIERRQTTLAFVARRGAEVEITIHPIIRSPLPDRLLTTFAPSSSAKAAQRRVRALVALRLLEAMRDQDVPSELLEEEDTTVTLPRRLGLSDVVGRQIRTFRQDVRRGVRLTDEEIRDLFRLVIRRPDADDIFFKVGQALAGAGRPGWRRFLPRRMALALARGRVRRRLKALFGRRVGGMGRGSFSLEGRSLLFIEADPGGDACALVTGLCQTIIEQTTGHRARVSHTLCQSRRDALCRWEGELLEGTPELPPPPADPVDG